VASGPWRMFLSAVSVPARGASGPFVGATRRANCPRGSVVSSSLTYGCPFRPWVTLGQLSSPKRGPVGLFPAPPHHQTVSASLWVWLTPVVSGDGVGLSPVSVDCHCVQAKPPSTPSRRDDQPYRVPRAASAGRHGASADFGAWHRDEAETWSLPNCPCLAPSSPFGAGCVPFREESSSTDFRTGTAPRG
jgi:hypothetical protein